jgi:hypothetical protein
MLGIKENVTSRSHTCKERISIQRLESMRTVYWQRCRKVTILLFSHCDWLSETSDQNGEQIYIRCMNGVQLRAPVISAFTSMYTTSAGVCHSFCTPGLPKRYKLRIHVLGNKLPYERRRWGILRGVDQLNAADDSKPGQ